MRRTSLATQFTLVVLLGAVVPMSIVGLWLTDSSSRSGRALLREQLTASADAVDQAIRRNWSARDGELQLLTRNTSARRLLRSNQPLSTPDSTYLAQLAQSLRPAISSFTYVDRNGGERWTSPADSSFSERAARARAFGRQSADNVILTVPVVDDDNAAIGAVRTVIQISALLPSTETIRQMAGNARVIIGSDREVLWSETPDSVDVVRAKENGTWEFVSRDFPLPQLRLSVGAPAAPYVRPFQLAARTGTTALLIATVATLLITALIARRLVSSLATLADAADDVARGNLQRAVEVSGSNEVVRVANAFNAMTIGLRDSLAELSRQRSLAAVGEFAAGLSHDVRNSLTAVRIDLQHAQRQLPDDHASLPLVRRAIDSVRRLDSTVTSALRIARPSEQLAVSLCEPLSRAIEASMPVFAERGALLSVDIGDKAEVFGNAGALEQMFLNLLLNAAQAVGSGQQATCRMESRNTDVVIEISDNGVGIEPERLSSIGVPFHSSKENGTGLGLPLARRIIEKHGGTLAFESTRGIGTRVTVMLPLTVHAVPEASNRVS